MIDNIYITGMGIVSSIGFNVAECLNAFKEGKSGIELIRYLDTKHRGKLLAGEVKASDEDLIEILQLEDDKNFSRTALLGIMAAREAYKSANLSEDTTWRLGIISSTSVGGIDRSEVFYKEYIKDPNKGKLRYIISHDCGDSTEKMADDLNIKDYVSTISTACSSSANAIMLGARLIKHGVLDQVIVGGVDAMTKYTLNGFHALRILDDRFCRPFDKDRNGLNLGEGAAFIVLESEKAIKGQKKEPLCELIGYGNANDAYHQTASSPQGFGALSAMQLALNRGGIVPNKIDYINAHGTATINNDLSEGTAFKQLFKDYIPQFSSTKSFTGHTLAAAGAVEAVISVLSLQHKILLPNLNFSEPITELALSPITTLQKDVNINHILSNSFGFGGNCSSLVFANC